MQIKYTALCYVQHYGREPYIMKEVEFDDEPRRDEIRDVLDSIELDKWDYEIDYSTGAKLPDDMMPKKCRVQRIYAVVEKRYYREVEK